MGSTVTRRSNSGEYLYYVYYDNKERIEVYCGKVDDPNTAKNLRSAELEDLKSQKDRIIIRMNELKGAS